MAIHTYDAFDAVTNVRLKSDTVFIDSVSDSEISVYINDALSSLYDKLTATVENYSVKRTQFTLQNGDGTNHLNEVPLPTDFYKELGVDLFLDGVGQRRTPVFPASFAERDNISVAVRQYTFYGDSLAIIPPITAAGTYELSYKPLAPNFLIPVSVAPNGTTDGISTVSSTARLTMNGYTFTSDHVGMDVIIAGASNATNNGTWKITAIASSTQVVINMSLIVNETFTTSVAVKIQTPGTIYVLPQIFLPWKEYLEVHAARTIKSKREQDTSDISDRIAKLEERIDKMAANRMSEGGQIPLTNNRSTIWDEPKFGVLG